MFGARAFFLFFAVLFTFSPLFLYYTAKKQDSLEAMISQVFDVSYIFTTSLPGFPSTSEANEMASGWPLGLENMNTRLRVVETLRAESSEPNSFRVASFSSFTSSDLDTESTRSFFQDHSITLGRLIGLRPGEGELYFTNAIRQAEERERISMITVRSNSSKRQEIEEPRGICVPLLLSILVKLSPSRSSSRQ